MASETDTAGGNTSNNVYIKSPEHGWIPARLLESDNDKEAKVSVAKFVDEQSMQSDGKAPKAQTTMTIRLSDYPNQALPLQNVDEHGILKEVEDMVDLPFLHEAAILYNLKARHVRCKPYTRTGDIVIAVNPYQWMLDLYSQERKSLYANALVWDANLETGNGGDARATVEPHVYETSSLSYRGLAVDQQNQSILVSGESGAGKTETVKILMNHLASVQQLSNNNASNNENNGEMHFSPIVQRVVDSNPLLEAFGNAKTVRNDNSSRFGKYLQLQFEAEDATHAAFAGKVIPSCLLAGSKCEVYLLEKSRVVSHEEEERTYHIFYQLLAQSDSVKADIWEGLEGTDNESFLYVGWTDTERIEGKKDAERFDLTKEALALVGVDDAKFRMLMRAICVVLQLGNLTFDALDGDEDKSKITSRDELEELASLMMAKEGEDEKQDDRIATIEKALTQRIVRARGEEFVVPLKVDLAKDSCDALAKEIYSKAFLWLVRQINDATCAEYNYKDGGGNASRFGIIGLLDIFGFESFKVNRFEQLCINYANEKLQQKFTQDIFRSVQAEYEYEGIAMGEISYEDNVDVLHLVEGRLGLIALLNEECVRPKGSDSGFVSKMKAMNKESDVLVYKRGYRDYEFTIQHYAGPVKYDATFFVTKNMDRLPQDLLECAKQSSNEIIAKELEKDSMMNERGASDGGTAEAAKKKAKKRPGMSKGGPGSGSMSGGSRRGSTRLVHQTVWTKFKGQLGSLMSSLSETRTRYIRCIKPNTMKKPQVMMHNSTVEQLRCAGVVAAVTISRSAFPNRLEHDVVLERFKALKPGAAAIVEEGNPADPADAMKQSVDQLLTFALRSMQSQKNGKTVHAFVIGKTRAYFRAGALEFLESERLKGLSRQAITLQRMVRGYLFRSIYLIQRNAAIRAEAQIREFLARRRYLKFRSACVVAQCWIRMKRAKALLWKLKRDDKATHIQTTWRMLVARASFAKHRKAAIVMQAMTRGALQRPKFRYELHEKREEAKLENQLKSLQRKLEEAEQRRIEAEKKAEEAKKQPPVVQQVAVSAATTTTAAAAAVTSSTPGRKLARAVGPAMPPQPAPGQLTAQQQHLMDESGKMLEYLRKEVFKLRSQNTQLRTDFDLLKENNQRLMDANASAGASFAALNQHAKQLNKNNARLQGEVETYKEQFQKVNLAQVEIKEELKMKQATYVAEVHSRLQYQKTMAKIVDLIQDRCRDQRLVEDVLHLSDECETEYMSGPTGMDMPGSRRRRGVFSPSSSDAKPLPGGNMKTNGTYNSMSNGGSSSSFDPQASDGSVLSRFRGFFG